MVDPRPDMNSNVGTDSPIVGKGESGQGEGLVVVNVTVESNVNDSNDQQNLGTNKYF